jgi:dienelactone hydrolase
MTLLRRFTLLCIALCLAPLPLVGEDVGDGMQQAMLHSFAMHDYPHAEQACRQLLARHPEDGNMSYNLACALAREGKTPEALAALQQAASHGFNDADHALLDDDLTSLHAERAFQAAIDVMRTHLPYEDAPCETLQQVPGTRVLERTPSAGMHYRLYIASKATPTEPARLMVWLHPSGGSMDDHVLALLAPDLIVHGWALMIFPQKHYDGWDQEGCNRMQACVADAYAEPAVDHHRPVPLTFSAGGQLALEIWFQQPDYWSALVLDAAYPTDYRTGKPRPLSPQQVATKIPVLAIVGARDPSGAQWNEDAPRWTAAGVPTTLVNVPAAGHQFLYTGETWTKTLAWLDDLERIQLGIPPTTGKPERTDSPRTP